MGHSLGGAVALMAGYQSPARFDRLIIIASAAYWIRPRLWVTLAAAPYVMASRSPFFLRSQRQELRSGSEAARHASWSYQCRPPGSLNRQTASALRRFDARDWSMDVMPPITWVVTSLDGVIDPTCQRASADLFGAEVVDVEGGHSVVGESPDAIARIIDR